MKNKTFPKIEEVNGKLSDARKRLRDFQFDLKALAKEHNVKFINELHYE